MNYLEDIKASNIRLNDVPLSEKTYELCLEAVKLNVLNIEFVPIEHRTIELCSTAHDIVFRDFFENSLVSDFYKHCSLIFVLNHTPKNILDEIVGNEKCVLSSKGLEWTWQ